MKNTTISTKLTTLVISSILIVSIIILVQTSFVLKDTAKNFTDNFEKEAYKTKEVELKNYIQIALNTVEFFYNKSKENPLKTEQYKKDALEAIKGIKFGNSGYFWINNSTPTMIMHPTIKNLNNQNLSKIKDSNGVYFFNKMVDITSNNSSGGLVSYKIKKPNSSESYQKFSYVMKFKPWDWIIGTGEYVDHISTSVNEMKAISKDKIFDSILLNIATIIVIMFILIFIVISIARKTILNPLQDFQHGLLDFFKYLNDEKDNVTLLNSSYKDEIGLMGNIVNQGIQKVEDTFIKKNIEEWIKDGVNELNQILINIKDTKEVSDKSINFICDYINSGIGVFYFFDEDKQKLIRYAGFADVIQNDTSSVVNLKEGIVGQVAFQKKAIFLKDIKKNSTLITTGTISQEAYNIYTYPLIYNDTLYGVIEVGSFSEISDKDLEFFEATKKIICLALSNSIQDKKVKLLLENTKKSNRQLEENQLKLEAANAYMEEQQQELEEVNANMEEQQQELEESNANMEEKQQQLKVSEQNLKLQNHRLEETKNEIEKKAKELEQSGKYKSEFLANMSHELRTPLNSVILLSSLLQKNSKKTLNKDDIKKAKTIFDSGNELLRLINDILDLSKVESGKMQVIIDNFNSTNFLEQMKETFDFTAIERGLDFNIIDEYNSTISNDKDRLAQIVRNLISNAFKFTKEGSITLKISSSKSKNFKISVIDTGIGIEKDKQEIIFKAFTQADGGTSREFGGTGLGLSISRELSKLLGGFITVESENGKGSTFSVELPNLANSDIEHYEIINTKKVEKIQNSFTKTSQVPIIETINDDRDILSGKDEAYLIIDDDKIFTEIVYEEIKKDNNFALVALTATSGLELIKKFNIKGIMLDLTLPDMDGIDVLKELKSHNKTRHIPVHVISSKDKNNESLKLGAIGYLQKPVFDGDINNIIDSIDSFQEKQIKDLLIFEQDIVHREALIELIGVGVNIKGVNTAAEAIKEVKKEKYDTVVVELDLMYNSGYEVCEYIKNTHPKLPIIIYARRDLNSNEKIKMQEYSNSIIIKTVNSNEKALSEINLFLHRDDNKIEESNEIFESIDLKDTNILIVDDDIKNIFVLDAALKEFEANTHTAFNGQEALEFLEKNQNIDLILMDIMMPVMDGYEAMERIRQNPIFKEIPVIAVTAKAMKEDKEKCLRLGADDYLSKPIDINILGKLIRAWSKKKHS